MHMRAVTAIGLLHTLKVVFEGCHDRCMESYMSFPMRCPNCLADCRLSQGAAVFPIFQSATYEFDASASLGYDDVKCV